MYGLFWGARRFCHIDFKNCIVVNLCVDCMKLCMCSYMIFNIMIIISLILETDTHTHTYIYIYNYNYNYN